MINHANQIRRVGIVHQRGRLVHAKRARRLRKRGDIIVWEGGNRYRWLPLAEVILIESHDRIINEAIALRIEGRRRRLETLQANPPHDYPLEP